MHYNLSSNTAALQAFGWLKEVITTVPVPAVPNLEAPYFAFMAKKGSSGMWSPMMGLYIPDLAAMNSIMGSAISAYLGAGAGIPDPYFVSDATKYQADWYCRSIILSNCTRNYTCRDRP